MTVVNINAAMLEVLANRTWQQWDRQRLQKTGGTLEQYKHPCLIPDPKFRETRTQMEGLETRPAEEWWHEVVTDLRAAA